ncbi:hypothetical protein WDU94_001380 [Cyamophila willieti]
MSFENKLQNKNMDEINSIMNDSFKDFKNALLEIIDHREFKFESELTSVINNVKEIIESIEQTNDINANKVVLSKIRVMLDDKENDHSLSQVSVSENSMYIIEKISKSLNDLDKENSKIQRIIEKQVREEEKLVNIENLIEPSNELIKNINKINHSEGELLKTLIEPIETVKEAICEIRNQSDDNQGYIDINDTKNKHIMKNITRSISDLKTVLEIMQSQIESSEDMAGTLEDMTNLEALANHLQELKDKLVIVMKDTPLLELSKYPRNDITRNVFEIILKPVEDLNQGLMKIENYALEPVVNEWTAREVLKGITKPIEDLLLGISNIKNSFPMAELIKIPTLELIEKMIKPLECVEKGIAALTIKEFPDDRFSDEDSYMSEGTTLASISEITNEEASMGYDTVLEPTLQKKVIPSVSDSSTEHCVYSPKELQKVLREKTLSPQNSKSEEEDITKKEELSVREPKSKREQKSALMEENTSLKSITSLSFDKPTNDNKDDSSESDTILLKSPKKDSMTIKHVDLETTSQKLQIDQVEVLSHKAQLINSLIKKESIIHEILEVIEPQKPTTKELKTHLSEKSEIIKEILVTETKIDNNLTSIQDSGSEEFKSAQALSAEEKQILMDEIKLIENLCSKKQINIENVKYAETQFAECKEVINLQRKAEVIENVLNTDTAESDNTKLDKKRSLSKQLLSITESTFDVQAFKLNESQEKSLSKKAELIESLVKKECVINEILKISEAEKPVTTELKSHLAQKAEIIKNLLNTEVALDQKLQNSIGENDKMLELQSAQALSLEDKNILKNEIKVIENLCEQKEIRIENLQAAKSEFAQTHKIDDLLEKSKIIEGVLNKHLELVSEENLKSIDTQTDSIGEPSTKSPEKNESNKRTLIQINVAADKVQKLNISQEQALAHKAELIDSLIKKESILHKIIQVSDAQKPLSAELTSHLAEKAKIIEEIFKAEARVDKEINETSEQIHNNELEELKSAQALTPADKEKLLNEVNVIENICNKTGIKIEILQQAEAQFTKSHEVESLKEKAEVIEKMLQKEIISQQAQSSKQDLEGVTDKVVRENKMENPDLNRDLALSHKAELIESLAKKENILTEILQISSPQKTMTGELKSHLAEKSEIIKNILETEKIIDKELENTATVTLSSAVKTDQALSSDDKCKLLNEIKTIEGILDSRSKIKIETLQKAEAQFAKTGEIQRLLEKAAIINKSIQPRTEDIEKKPDQGKLEQTPSDDYDKTFLQKETVTEKSEGGAKLKNLQVEQIKVLSQKAELIESLIKKDNIINEMFKISETQKPLTVELKSQLTGKADIMKALLKIEETVDQALKSQADQNKDLRVEEFKTSQSLSVKDKKRLLQEVSLIEDICNRRGVTIENIQQAEAQLAESHEVENILKKAKIIECALQQEHIEHVNLEVFNLRLENINDLMKQAKVIEVLLNTNLTQEEFASVTTLQCLTNEQKTELSLKNIGIQNSLEEKSNKEMVKSANEMQILSQKAEIIDSLLKLEELSINQIGHEKTTKISEEHKKILLKKAEMIESLLQKSVEKELIDELQETSYLSFNEINSLYQQAKCIEIMLKPDMSAEELENLTKLQKLTTKQQNILSDRATNLLKLTTEKMGKLPKELDKAQLKAQKIQSLLNLESEIVATGGNEKLQPTLLKEKVELIKCILRQEAMEPYKQQLFTVEETKNLAQQAKHINELVEKNKKGETNSEELQSTINKDHIDELTNKYKKIQDVIKQESLYMEVLSMPEAQSTNVHTKIDIVQQQAELLENLIQVETTLDSEDKMGVDKILLQKQRASIIQDILKKEIIKDTLLGTTPDSAKQSFTEQREIETEEYERNRRDNLETTDSTAVKITTILEVQNENKVNQKNDDQKKKKPEEKTMLNAEKKKKEEKAQLEAETKKEEPNNKAKLKAEKKKEEEMATLGAENKEEEEEAKLETEKKKDEKPKLEAEKKEEEEKGKLEAEKKKKEEVEKAKLEAEKQKKEKEEKTKQEAEKKKKEEEEKAKLEAKKKKEEEEKAKLEAEKKKVEEEKAKLEAETQKKEEEEKAKLEAEKKKKEEEEKAKLEAEKKKKEEEEKAKLEAEKKKKEEEEKAKLEAEKKKNEEEEKAKLEAEKKKKEEEEKAKLEAEKKRKEEEEKAKLEAEKKKKEEDEKTKLEAEKKKKEEEEKSKLEAEKKKKEEDEKTKLEAEKKKKEEEEKAKLEAEKKKKEEEEKAKLEAEKKKKEEEEKAKLEAEKKKKEEEEKAKLEAEKKKKEEEEKAKLEAEKKKKEEEEKAKLEAEKKKKEEEEKAKLEAEKKKKEEEEKAKLEAEKKKKEEEEKAKLEAEKKKKEEEVKAKLEAEKKKEEEEKAKLDAEKKKKEEEEEKSKLEAEKKRKAEEEKAKLEAEKHKKEKEEKAKLEAEKKKKEEKENAKLETEKKKKEEEEEKSKLEAEKKKKEEEKAKLEVVKIKEEEEKAKPGSQKKKREKSTEFETEKKDQDKIWKEKEHIEDNKKGEEMVDQVEKIEVEKKEEISNGDTIGTVIWSSSVETSGTIKTDLHSEDNTIADKTRLKKNAVDFKAEVETITNDKEPKQELNDERKKEKKISQFLPENFKRQNGHLQEDETSVPHPYRKEFSADVMAKKRLLQELSSEGATGGDVHSVTVGDVEKAFYTNESALLDSKPKFSLRLQDKSATQGTTLCLSCSILYTKDSVKYAPWYAPDLVEWYKDGQNILLLGDFKRYQTFFCENTATLEIKDCKLTDSGQFTCLARNKYGRSSTSCIVKVYANLEPAPMGPVFSKLIKEHYKFLDDELTLECRVKCFPPAKITWLKDNIPIRPINRYYQTELSDGVCRLTICSPDQSDTGKYTCRAEHDVWTEHTYYFLNFQGRDYHTLGKVGRRSQSSGSLQVVEKHMWHPQKPSILRGLLDDVVPSGGTLALHVQVQGYVKPEVIWLRGNMPIPKSSPRFKYIEDSNNLHTLILSGVTAEESGRYTCRVSNEYGYTETFAKVDVINVSSGALKHEKPAMFVTRPDTMMSVALGEDVSFSFRLAGSPKPKVTWMKGIRDITTSTRTMTETVNDYVRLTLKRATDDDNGTYFIVARNIYGSDRAFVTVRVRQRARSMNALNFYKPEISSIYQGIHENFKEQFNTKDVPEQISEPPIVSASGRNWLTLTWLKPQSDVLAPVLAYKVEAWKLGPDGGGFWNELGISATSSFDAFNLTPGAQYRFRVTPRNRYGWGESTMTNTPVTIGEHMGLPEFAEDLPGQLKVLVGSDVTLDGVVHSSTTPDIKWLKDGTIIQIEEDDRLVTNFNEGKVSLTIHDLKQEDDGRYICEAVNKVGRVSSYARLMVVTDPKLIEADHGLRKITQEACPIVNTAPQFTMRLRDRRVQVSYPVRLTCQLVAYPAPTVSWYKDDVLIFQTIGTTSSRTATSTRWRLATLSWMTLENTVSPLVTK